MTWTNGARQSVKAQLCTEDITLMSERSKLRLLSEAPPSSSPLSSPQEKIFSSDIPMTLSVCLWYFAVSSNSHLFIPGAKGRLLIAASIKIETHRVIKNGHSCDICGAKLQECVNRAWQLDHSRGDCCLLSLRALTKTRERLQEVSANHWQEFQMGWNGKLQVTWILWAQPNLFTLFAVGVGLDCVLSVLLCYILLECKACLKQNRFRDLLTVPGYVRRKESNDSQSGKPLLRDAGYDKIHANVVVFCVWVCAQKYQFD